MSSLLTHQAPGNLGLFNEPSPRLPFSPSTFPHAPYSTDLSVCLGEIGLKFPGRVALGSVGESHPHSGKVRLVASASLLAVCRELELPKLLPVGQGLL